MPSPEFLVGLLALGLTFTGALLLAAWTGLDPTYSLIGVAIAAWGVFALWERRLSRDLDPGDVQPIHVDWDDRLTDTDFAADGADTARDLADRGLTADTAVGQSFVFATEHAHSGGDIWFEGEFLRSDDRIVIRATEPV